jgi:hypothetical protein
LVPGTSDAADPDPAELPLGAVPTKTWLVNPDAPLRYRYAEPLQPVLSEPIRTSARSSRSTSPTSRLYRQLSFEITK